MRVWTLNELFRLTRAELFQLHAEITARLGDLPEGSREYLTALANLRLIRRVLARPQHTPG
jgi:hypothetical protein